MADDVTYKSRPRTAYLCARFERKPELIAAEELLKQHNILPGTQWLHKETDMRVTPDPERRRQLAVMDVEDVLNADMLVAFSENTSDPNFGTLNYGGKGYVPTIWARGGRHVEFGIAIGCCIPIVVIGPMENLFHWYDARIDRDDDTHKPVMHFDTLEAFVQWYDENNVLPEGAKVLGVADD